MNATTIAAAVYAGGGLLFVYAAWKMRRAETKFLKAAERYETLAARRYGP